MRKKTGLLAQDPKDIRDYELAEIQSLTEVVPEEYDLRSQMTPAGKQNWGSCTCWSACAVAEFWNTKEYHIPINLSEKFVYHNMKKISGLWNIQGDYLINAIKSLCKYGVPETKDYPDKKELSWDKYVKKEPSPEIYKKAEKYKGKTYWSVGRSIKEIQSAIFQNKCPVAIGMSWYSVFNKPAKDGKLPLPSGKKYGGHAFACVGWTKDKLWFKNSWGSSWGKNGYFYIPFENFSKYSIWNARVLLDVQESKQTGWVAIKYLRADTYAKGTNLTATTELRVREKPNTQCSVVMVLGKNKQCKILDDEVVEANGYRWQEIEVI
jgi:C1A family cysteine protease